MLIHKKKLKHLLRTIYTLGIKNVLLIIYYRYKKKYFIQRLRSKALSHQAHTTYEQLEIECGNWLTLKNNLMRQELPFVHKLFSSQHHAHLAQAANYAHNKFQVLGSQEYLLDDAMWHTDIGLKQQAADDYIFSSTLFYDDIGITVGQTQSLQKDIKVPWELSRLQHLPLLGYAYSVTHDDTYKDAFVYHVMHWRKHNPYLLGINWLCPMEVALRSISLVLAWHYFKHAAIEDSFWQSYVTMLYDHKKYLEHNWEWYDGRTSNHYLADLVGYLYLCWFFISCKGVNKDLTWCVKKIEQEVEKQIFDEGTSYEGSTKYHILVTELVYYVQQLCIQMNIALSYRFEIKLSRMFEFIKWCTINTQDYITIGDDDSGKVAHVGLPTSKLRVHDMVKHYSRFGVSFFKDRQWHISLRHHAYDARQPSGHYHNDAGSITVAFNRIPIIIDPGSYTYTPSRVWRNYFRSAASHNVASIEHIEPVSFDQRLFALTLPEKIVSLEDNNEKLLQMSHRLYDRYKLMYNRKIICRTNIVEITDNWLVLDTINEDIVICSNLIFDQQITLQKEQDIWIICYNDKPLLTLHSSHEMMLQDGYKATCYGKLVPVKKLSAIINLKRVGNTQCTITISNMLWTVQKNNLNAMLCQKDT